MSPRLKVPRWIARYLRARDGATAVEFSLIALPFFALLFAILELGIIYTLSAALDNAAVTVSRTIRTGQIASSTYNSASGFQSEICKSMGWTPTDCAGSLAIDVRKMTTYKPPTTLPPMFDAAGKPVSNFTPTAESEIVLVRAAYRWKVFTPLLNQALASSPDGTRLVTSTFVFRNEPFGS
jgi:Flp pilus assembly protein TadG